MRYFPVRYDSRVVIFKHKFLKDWLRVGLQLEFLVSKTYIGCHYIKSLGRAKYRLYLGTLFYDLPHCSPLSFQLCSMSIGLCAILLLSCVTRFGNLLDFGQVFKAFGNN